MVDKYLTGSPEALAAAAADVPKNIWVHGSITFIFTGEDYIPPENPASLP